MKVYPLFRPFLFRLDPEFAHHLTLSLLHNAGEIKLMRWLLHQLFDAPFQPVHAFGLEFPNPIGLAAGYDKDGLAWQGLACLGFGHIEIGTVTLRPQPGNPKPRLFRLPAEKALINRLGFPGLGAEFVIKEIKKPRPERLVLGVNLGKNKDTPLESAAEDYQELLRIFAPHADYLTINISSPNTEGLRSLQQKQALEHLLRQINSERKRISQTLLKRPPILIKLSPDLSDLELEDALDVILSNNMDGIIATNTTLCREGLVSDVATETGGLSGVPLFSSSLELVRKIALHVGQALPIIGVGGINNATGVIQMLDAGATLVQIYTGLIYEGPGLVKRILQELQKN